MRLLYILIIYCSNIFAQDSTKIDIINANYTFANSKKHPDYWRLVGDVSFKHDNTIMSCDSAYHFIEEQKIKAFSRIKIIKGDSIILKGEKLTYFGHDKKANIIGNVSFKDNHMLLKTEELSYNLELNIASYPSKGEIFDNDKKIKSEKGSYYANINTFIFNDSVTVFANDYNIITNNMHYNTINEYVYFYGPSYINLEKSTIYCENGWYNTQADIAQFNENNYITQQHYLIKGDSLYYEKNNGFGKAIGNIQLIDTIQNTIIQGGIAEYYEKNNQIEITQKPILQLLFKSDTLFMSADRFLSYKTLNDKKILAYKNVKFFKKDFQGKCDSLSYILSDSLLEMFKNPVIWINQFQMTSDSLKATIFNSKIETIHLKNNSMIIEKDSLDYNQIKGKEMLCSFKKNELKKIKILSNGQSIFFVKDDENNKIGLNYFESTDLTLYFLENKLNDITYHIKPESKTIPYKELKEKDKYLKEFFWRINEKPINKNDIFTEQS